MGFGFSNEALPVKDDAVTDTEDFDGTATAAELEEVDNILTDLATSLHRIASDSRDPKAVKVAVNALLRSGIKFGELK